MLTLLEQLDNEMKNSNTTDTKSRSVTKWRCSPNNVPNMARIECCFSTSRKAEMSDGESIIKFTISLRIYTAKTSGFKKKHR